MFRYVYATQRLSRHIFWLKQELKDGETEVQLKAAKDAYANFVKVGTVVTTITTPATISAAVAAGKKIVLTIAKPGETAGFIKFTTAE